MSASERLAGLTPVCRGRAGPAWLGGPRAGCPHGSLCSELDKRLASPGFALAELMRVPIEWAEEQFRALGRRDAHDLAVSLIAAYEGSALLANTFRDPDILAREARRLNRWIDTL